jgi:signal transduction histidine kinase
LRNLSTHQQRTREQERKKIAREIHDELGQALTALKMDLSWLSKRIPQQQRGVIEKTESMSRLIDNTINTLRRIASELRPSLLDDLGIIAAIEWQASQFEKTSGIKCRVRKSFRSLSLGQDHSLAAFRILQESLTNVLRHAAATEVKIGLDKASGNLIIDIVDNGRGISHEECYDQKSLGLTGMRERALSIGGEVIINGITGKGTTVNVSIPLKAGAK